MEKMNIGPGYRFGLRAKMYESGFKTVKEFSLAAGSDPTRISRVFAGWEFPSPQLAAAMAAALGITHEKFKELILAGQAHGPADR